MVISQIFELTGEFLERVARPYLLDFMREQPALIVVDVQEALRLILDLIQQLCDFVISVKSIANLWEPLVSPCAWNIGVEQTHVFRFITNAICNALLEALKIFVDITLLLQHQHPRSL
jgi:hypothetical protein